MSDTWKGKTRGALSGYKFFVFLLRNVGVSFAYKFLKIIVFYYYLFAPKAFSNIYYTYRRRLDFGFFKTIFGIYRNYGIFGQTLLDRFVAMAGIKNKLTFNFDGEEYIRKMAEDGKGGFLISAHLGNWEIAGHLLKRIPARFNIVMLDSEREKIKNYIESEIEERPVNFIFIRNDLGHIFEMNNALRRGEIICIHADRFIEGVKTYHAEFLGKKARFPSGPFELAHKLKVPYAFVFAVKESNTHYHFFSNEYKVSREGPESIFHEYIDQLEEKVRKYPYQWFNYYDFWERGT